MVDSMYKGGAVGGAVGGPTNLVCTVLFVPNVRRGGVCTGDVCNDTGVVCSGAGATRTSSKSIK